MRILNGFRWAFTLAFICSSASADLILDNQRVITNINGIVISPTTGDITISTVSKDYVVTQGNPADPADPVAVSITSFTATPSTIDEGKSTTVSWATQNADSCAVVDSADQLNGDVGTSGSVGMTINTEGTYTMTLTCQGLSGPVSRVLTITVQKPAVVPTKTCSASPLSGVTASWSGFWSGNFPGPNYQNKDATVARSGYLALEFKTGDIIDDGMLVTVGNTVTSGVRLGAISECPGDFDVKAACDHKWGIGGGINWATDGSANACQLKPNTTYYFNVTYTNGFDPATTSCTSSQCIATLQHVNL